MKYYNKHLNIFIILLIFFINGIKSQVFKGNQKESLNDLFTQLYGNPMGNLQCFPNNIQVKCIWDDNGLASVSEINLSTLGGIPMLTVDFSVFEDLVDFKTTDHFSFSPNIFTRLPNFKSPATMKFQNFKDVIPENIILPLNLKNVVFENINVSLPNAFLTTGSIENLIISSTGKGFTFPKPFPINYYLRNLTVVINEIGNTFPSDMGFALKNLNDLTLSFQNTGTTNIKFPKIVNFTQLSSLIINFQYENETNQLFDFDPSINNIDTLTFLEISGYGIKSDKIIDISNLKEGITLKFSDIIEYLKNLKFPQGCSIFLNSFYMSIGDIDFTNATSLTVTLSRFNQSLPPFSNFNSKKLITLNLNGNTFNGSIPNEYCYFGKYVLNLGNNVLSGNVPDCFLCYGGADFPNLFPNSDFLNFYPSKPAIRCEDYLMDLSPLSTPFSTNQTTVLTIPSEKIGWDIILSATIPDVIAEIVVPNKEFTISIPPAAGRVSGLLFYGYQAQMVRSFTFSYVSPIIDSYYINGPNIYFKGSNFSFNPNFINKFTINGNPYTANTQTLEDVHGITFPSENNPVSVLKNREPFNVSITIHINKSPIVTFIYFGNITLTNSSQFIFNTTGGDITLDGEFGIETTDFSKAIIEINNIQVTINQISETQINFTYPSIANVDGTYPVFIEIDGFKYTTEFEFIGAPTLPPTQTPSKTPTETPSETPTETQTLSPTPTQTQTNSPTPTPKPSESNELSCSPNLSNSFVLLISLIFAFFLII
ncbi:hypothetical protein DDB_G0267684 [Dictyostelium discoideum AX4]|uniref:Uncharacterized protein n=1 Tax=Dictyostelium discoideum TaxID=44689 RepID=Q1ZXR1_DICDI|nr:hypothetical protein DDB_G0267684 [Dictyostelium discoideum AX4]EAS66946.1 hypothetical protein DDB_G0267684 [Dictyostelium discoideum AX4]|eukprot:XP_001134483.1 hypothetical protein DDB_G0267684 [Dictyostelium discoideum AX4]